MWRVQLHACCGSQAGTPLLPVRKRCGSCALQPLPSSFLFIVLLASRTTPAMARATTPCLMTRTPLATPTVRVAPAQPVCLMSAGVSRLSVACAEGIIGMHYKDLHAALPGSLEHRFCGTRVWAWGVGVGVGVGAMPAGVGGVPRRGQRVGRVWAVRRSGPSAQWCGVWCGRTATHTSQMATPATTPPAPPPAPRPHRRPRTRGLSAHAAGGRHRQVHLQAVQWRVCLVLSLPSLVIQTTQQRLPGGLSASCFPPSTHTRRPTAVQPGPHTPRSAPAVCPPPPCTHLRTPPPHPHRFRGTPATPAPAPRPPRPDHSGALRHWRRHTV